MKNNILNKRTYWEASYDKLKLETDQNKELVKSIFSNLTKENERLKDQNNSLLEALKEIVASYKMCVKKADQSEYVINAEAAIKKTETN